MTFWISSWASTRSKIRKSSSRPDSTRPPHTASGRASSGSCCRGCSGSTLGRAGGDDGAIDEELHVPGVAVDHDRDVVPAGGQPAGCGQLATPPPLPPMVMANRRTPVLLPPWPGSGTCSRSRPSRSRRCVPRASRWESSSRSSKVELFSVLMSGPMGRFDVVVGAVALHGAVDLADGPRRPVDQRAVVLVGGRVDRRCAGLVIEYPPADG